MALHLCIDFDGVIHSYKSGWKGADQIPDEPVDGAIVWLKKLVADGSFIVNIYSSRSKQKGGIEAMRQWLMKHGMPKDILNQIEFPTQKPPAYLTIDDRAICFNGTFPTIKEMFAFKPWHKR